MFNRRLLDGTLEPFYLSFMEEMKKGFGKITVQSEADRKKVKDFARFFCIGHIEVEIRT